MLQHFRTPELETSVGKENREARFLSKFVEEQEFSRLEEMSIKLVRLVYAKPKMMVTREEREALQIYQCGVQELLSFLGINRFHVLTISHPSLDRLTVTGI